MLAQLFVIGGVRSLRPRHPFLAGFRSRVPFQFKSLLRVACGNHFRRQ